MIRKLTLSAALAVLTTGAVLAADLTPGTVLGTDHKAVAAALAAQGYDLVKFEQEHGRIEAKAMKNGQRWELKIDAKTGKITQVKADD
jgi:hypothetical protein